MRGENHNIIWPLIENSEEGGIVDFSELLGSILNSLKDLLAQIADLLNIQPPPLNYPGGMKVGLTAFGSPQNFNLLTALTEFKSFVEENSKLKLDINFVQEAKLPVEEIPRYDPTKECYMVTPQSLSPESKEKMPSGMKTDIVVYDTQNRVNCFGGLQWGTVVPFICIPYSNAFTWDSGWKTSLAPAIVHEFTHALYTILGSKGYQGLPNIDKANDYGYTEQNDPGWINFRKYCLRLITEEMAQTLMN